MKDCMTLRSAKDGLAVLLTYVLAIVMNSCDCGTEPPPPDNGPDTTSHDFVWQIDTVGDGNGSALLDVCIVDENNIWAVGQLYLRDTVTGQFDPQRYNVAHWDGRQWSYIRVMFPICGGVSAAPFPAYSVLGFGANEIWIVSSAQIARWNGTTFTASCIPANELAGSIRRIWGRDGNSIFAVGNLGAIVRFNGSVWQRIESGTTIDLVDLWGTDDSNIWVAGLDPSFDRSILLHYDGTASRKAYEFVAPSRGSAEDTMTSAVTSVWTMQTDIVWVLEAGAVFKCPNTTSGEGTRSWAPEYLIGFLRKIRGSASNDIFVVGDYGTVSHYNGSSWWHYGNLADFAIGNTLRSVAVSGNIAAIVGNSQGKGLVLRGRRQ